MADVSRSKNLGRRVLEVQTGACSGRPPSLRRDRSKEVAGSRHRSLGPFSEADTKSLGGLAAASTASIHGFRHDQLIAERFRIRRMIGYGGMGDIYEVQDLAIPSTPNVALKVIRPEISDDPTIIARFEREIGLAKIITHPNVCRIYDLGRHRKPDSPGQPGQRAEIPFVTMELLAGRTLAAELRDRGRLTTGEALPLIQQIAAALDAVHDTGIVHCDLKPSNIMLVPVGGRAWPKAVLMDFGLARRIGEGGDSGAPNCLDATGGTPDYMSPEQVTAGEIGTSSDIYSFGVLMYEMITGARPFAGPDGTTRMLKRLSDDPSPFGSYLPITDIEWETAILRCLSREPGQRFSRASDVISNLSEVGRRRSSQIASDQGPTTIPAKSFLAYLMSGMRRMAGRLGFG